MLNSTTLSTELSPSPKPSEVERYITPLRDVVDAIVDIMQESATDPPVRFWLATGIKSIDETIGSLHGLVAIESSTPWHGTQLAMMLAASMSRHLPAVIFTSKLSAHRTGELLFSLVEGMTLPALSARKFRNVDWDSISQTKQFLSALDLTLVETEEFSTEQITSILSEVQHQKGKVGLVVVDDALAVSPVLPTSSTMPEGGRTVPNYFRWVSKKFNATVITVVPPGLIDSYCAVSDVFMRVVEDQTLTAPQTFPQKLNVNISCGGFGYVGSVCLDLANLREEMD